MLRAQGFDQSSCRPTSEKGPRRNCLHGYFIRSQPTHLIMKASSQWHHFNACCRCVLRDERVPSRMSAWSDSLVVDLLSIIIIILCFCSRCSWYCSSSSCSCYVIVLVLLVLVLLFVFLFSVFMFFTKTKKKHRRGFRFFSLFGANWYDFSLGFFLFFLLISKKLSRASYSLY